MAIAMPHRGILLRLPPTEKKSPHLPPDTFATSTRDQRNLYAPASKPGSFRAPKDRCPPRMEAPSTTPDTWVIR